MTILTEKTRFIEKTFHVDEAWNNENIPKEFLNIETLSIVIYYTISPAEPQTLYTPYVPKSIEIYDQELFAVLDIDAEKDREPSEEEIEAFNSNITSLLIENLELAAFENEDKVDGL